MRWISHSKCIALTASIGIASFGITIGTTLFSLQSSFKPQVNGKYVDLRIFAGVDIGVACFVSLFLFLLLYAYRLKLKERQQRAIIDEELEGEEADAEFLQTLLQGLPKRFLYKELERATKNFKKKLGRGGFGCVYEGTLPDGSKVAVKRLERQGRGQKEFCAEVATISRVRHMNLVSLKGFCSEGGRRLIVYEFMPKGSLDRWLFHDKEETMDQSSSTQTLDWEKRFNIALGTARGLAYLHEECEDAILHLDVKPENILLDDNFEVKVSDFGLSRSMEKSQSHLVTTIRGTPGYLAPEWFIGAGIDSKIDVYSYGIFLLELVSGRRSMDQSLTNSDFWYLPSAAYKKLVVEGRSLDILDPVLESSVLNGVGNQAQYELLIKIALWCIQKKPAARPTMGTVVQMLEGTLAVRIPPLCPNFFYAPGEVDLPSLSISMPREESLSLPR